MLQEALANDAGNGTQGGKKKKKKKNDGSRMEMAGTGATEFNTTSESLGPAPDASFTHLDRMNITEGDAPMPYKSPYEAGSMTTGGVGGGGGGEGGEPATKSETVTF